MNTSPVLFRCPHCDQAVEIDRASLGDTVNCPNPQCGKPFEADAPRARPVLKEAERPADVEDLTAKEDSVEGDGVGSPAEETIEVIHPAMFRRRPLKTLGLLAVACAGLLGLVLWAFPTLGWAESIDWLGGLPLLVLSLIVLLGAGGWLGYWWLESRFITLRITTERSLLRHGIIAKATSEVRHCDVRNLQVDQNIVERLLGVGDIAISSAGQDDLEVVVAAIPHPNRIADRVRQMQ